LHGHDLTDERTHSNVSYIWVTGHAKPFAGR
jgi:hypothetical protein